MELIFAKVFRVYSSENVDVTIITMVIDVHDNQNRKLNTTSSYTMFFKLFVRNLRILLFGPYVYLQKKYLYLFIISFYILLSIYLFIYQLKCPKYLIIYCLMYIYN